MTSPLALTLEVALLATALATLTGVPLAWLFARGKFPGRDLLATLVLLPMVLPPTVLGFALLVAIGRRSPIGVGWEALFGGSLVFSPAAAVLASYVCALPFLVRTAQAGFEQVDRVYEEAARTLGRSEVAVFATVTAPLAWRAIAAGMALAFARAAGEFGATMMVGGNVPGRTQTASIAVYDAVQAGRYGDAALLAGCLAGGTAVVLLVVGRR